jgi:hypothetical protein
VLQHSPARRSPQLQQLLIFLLTLHVTIWTLSMTDAITKFAMITFP